ncbi:hypothetical protein CEUSTIGMA_g2390.t1 [Chlamydomonas eustigma]|uniref:Anaphase-promoting complex subunit 10 n=1 Tax=Chlamydomonas eustigma TaxID=1157962 RepID=A0A250WVS5_9CHLO|nr:hypothetical protein CEUSTIGMA_g2390.t1 [Chlamydomonas eustigma]|eukprot:GAX74944.1 hypothetical protein CEUSTIGMA_g2390.t1 [Chlamydomonas eustigma]
MSQQSYIPPSRTEITDGIMQEDEVDRNLKEIGHLAIWSVSSAKPGCGVDCLRDHLADTFWQSDGVQPHFINMQFNKLVEFKELRICLDYKTDESYTPRKFSIRLGTGVHDLREIRVVEVEEPSGCIRIPLMECAEDINQDRCKDFSTNGINIRGFFLQVAILSNHQNGRDTHVRGVSVFGPRTDPLDSLNLPCSLLSTNMQMYATVR